MKKSIVITQILLSMYFLSFSQNELGKSDDVARIALNAVVPDQIEEMPQTATGVLQNKLNQIVTKNGLGTSSLNDRFILTANVSVITKDITPSAPPMHAYTLEVSLYVGDGIDGTLFSSTTLTLKGVGNNENKAYVAALRNLNPNDKRLQPFIDQGKTKIIEYFNSRCDFILKEAEMLQGKGDYEAAIAKLVSIPEVCKECYEKAMDAVAPIYQQQIDRECKINLANAQNAWNQSQSYEGASNAAAYLGMIDPNASCYNDALNLSNSIAKRILEVDKREWNFKMKQHQDNVDLEKARIKAIRDIGVAYGNNQPRNVTYHYKSWW